MLELRTKDGNVLKVDNEVMVIIDGAEHSLKSLIDIYKQRSITDAIFSDDDILTQLHGSEMESDVDLIMNKEEFMRVIRETQQ